MPNVAAMSEVGAVFGDPARVRMLCRLAEGSPLSARALAECAGVTPQTASGHIAKLVGASLVTVERCGRQRLHRIAAGDAGELLSLVHRIGLRVRSDRCQTGLANDAPSRLARTCYDHLGGLLGAQLAQVLTERRENGLPILHAPSLARARSMGLELDETGAPEMTCSLCQSWSDEHLHIGGRLGAVLLRRSLELDWVRPRHGSRSLTITHVGSSGFREAFGIRLG